MKTIYIAGKVTGLPIVEVTHKFGQAQVDLEAKGFTVINPLAVVNDWHCPWPIAMRKCIAAMMTADAVLALPDWSASKGATVEVELAHIVGLPLYASIKDLLTAKKSLDS
jgi:hypothetical protein